MENVHTYTALCWSFGLWLMMEYVSSPLFILQLDDKEFDIPQVTNPPTLESILNEVSHDSDCTAVLTLVILVSYFSKHGMIKSLFCIWWYTEAPFVTLKITLNFFYNYPTHYHNRKPNNNNINFYIAHTPEMQINATYNKICIQNK